MSGIEVSGRNNLIEGNEIWGTIQHHPNNLAQKDATWLDADGMRFFGQGHVIRGNYIHDIHFGNVYDKSGNIIGVNINPHIDCFQTWSGTDQETASNIIFENNRCDMLVSQAANENGHGFMLAGGTNHLTIRNNIIKAYGGVNTGGTGGAHHLYIYNNVWINNPAFNQFYPMAITLQSATASAVKNNIFYNQPYHTVVAVGDTTGVDVDYNLAYNSNGSTPDCYRYGTYTCKNPPSIHDLWQVNPQFVDPAADNYHLLPASPAIDTGIDVGVTTDFDGNSRPQGKAFDIGAFEYLTIASPTPDVSPSSTPVAGSSPSLPPLLLGSGEVNGIPPVDLEDLRAVFAGWFTDGGGIPGQGADQYGDGLVNILDASLVMHHLSQ
jgi:hypothetical protein